MSGLSVILFSAFLPAHASGEAASAAPFLITASTHIGGQREYTGPAGYEDFQLTREQILWGVETFMGHSAKVTVSTELSFAEASFDFDDNVMAVVQGGGMGVGTHCETNAWAPAGDPAVLAEEFILRKEAVDALVGAENNLGCSGGQGATDWVLAAEMAGFSYITGLVGISYLSMEMDYRPTLPEPWTDDYIYDVAFFAHAPHDLGERIHPTLLEDASDFLEDRNGTVLASGGTLGRLDWMAERADGEDCRETRACELGYDDIEVLMHRLDTAMDLHDPGRVGKADIYIPASLYVEENRPIFDELLSTLRSDYVEPGLVSWATQAEVYRVFMEHRPQ